MANKIQSLDLRPMPPFERHEKIFQTWDSLGPGDTLKITNDHDPNHCVISLRWSTKINIHGSISRKGRRIG